MVIDLRGTGRSGALECPALQRLWFEGTAAAAATCAASLGPRRAFYTTDDAVEDVEAVRAALGAPQIALYGRYSGARVVLGYARRHPSHVERMLLDSPTDAGLIDPLRRGSMQAAPRILDRICAGDRCRGIVRDLPGDVRRLAAMLERRPVHGALPDGHGRRRPVQANGFDLLGLAGLIDPFGPIELPRAVRNALRGDFAPLLRAVAREPFAAFGPLSPRLISWTTYAATHCEGPGFPWPPDTPVPNRMALGLAFVQGLPAGAFGPFGPRAALGSDVIELCREWPATGRRAAVAGPLPSVPTLVVTGDELAAPLEAGRAIAAEIPGARVVVSRPRDSDSFSDGPTSCRGAVVNSFFGGDESWRTRRWCPGARFRAKPLAPLPMSLSDLAPIGGKASAGRTLAAVRRTLADGYVSYLFRVARTLLLDEPPRVVAIGALRAGSYRFLRNGRLLLRGASLVPGVRVTGWIGRPFDGKRRQGTLRVDGATASRGTLTVRRGVMSGRLGGRSVRARSVDPSLDRLLGDRD